MEVLCGITEAHYMTHRITSVELMESAIVTLTVVLPSVLEIAFVWMFLLQPIVLLVGHRAVQNQSTCFCAFHYHPAGSVTLDLEANLCMASIEVTRL